MSKRRAHATTDALEARPQGIGRRGALRAAAAAGLGLGAVSASPAAALADASRPGALEAERPGWALGERERALAAHALVPLAASPRRALATCEAAGVALVEAFEPRHGGLPFVVEIRHTHPDVGARRSFELVRGDAGGPAPIAEAGELALVLLNRGDGARASDEDDARLARRLAAALEPVAGVLAAMPLTTVRERARRAPFATLHVPLRLGPDRPER
jgi:hypothetical protein